MTDRDMKKGRRGLKSPLQWIPLWALQGVARVFDYGARKYAPGNWQRAGHEENPEQAFEDYASAALRHYAAMQEACPVGTVDWSAVDDESGLPHLDHLICSLVMLRGISQVAGYLPADPGTGKGPLATFEVAPAREDAPAIPTGYVECSKAGCTKVAGHGGTCLTPLPPLPGEPT